MDDRDGREANDLVIVLTYYHPYVSGLTYVAKDLAEGLAARGWRVCVVASKHDPSLPTHDEHHGVRIVRAPVLAKVGKGTVGLNLTRWPCANGPLPGGQPAPSADRGRPARAAVVPPGGVDLPLRRALPPGLVNAAQQRAVDLSNRIALPALGGHGGQQRGLRPAQPPVAGDPGPGWRRSRRRARRGSRAGRPSATRRRPAGSTSGSWVASSRRRGLEYLVDAFLALEDPEARLLIGGDYTDVAGGSVVERVRRHIGDDPRVRLLGFIDEADLDDFYASLDAFALPSVNAFEAFGIVQVVADDLRCPRRRE